MSATPGYDLAAVNATFRQVVDDLAQVALPQLTDAERQRYAEIAVIFAEALRPVIYEEVARAQASRFLGPL